jgi:protein-S-isoprenylcysteine O-methyltransferase Ste14
MALDRKDYLYVSIQFVLFAAYMLPIRFVEWMVAPIAKWFGLGVAVLGLLIDLLAFLQLNTNLSPYPTPKAGGELVQTGLYAYIRHPIYTGILLLTFGYAIHEVSDYKILVSIALLVLFYFKTSYEEKRLEAVYPEYPAYRQRVGRFLPLIRY